eukprot:1807814-Rhodomonas_salina.2
MSGTDLAYAATRPNLSKGRQRAVGASASVFGGDAAMDGADAALYGDAAAIYGSVTHLHMTRT